MSEKYIYSKSEISSDLLIEEINSDGEIPVVCEGISHTLPDILTIFMASELETAEKTQLDSLISLHTPRVEGFLHIEDFLSGSRVAKRIWWKSYDSGSETYSSKRYEAIYDWSGNVLNDITFKVYERDGVTEVSSDIIVVDEKKVADERVLSWRNIPESLPFSFQELI